MKKIFLIALISYSSVAAAFQSDSTSFFSKSESINKHKAHLINYSVAALYPLSMSWLYTQWYTDYPQSTFHFFNDNAEWLQMDKLGHTWDAYSISKPLFQLYNWAGYTNKQATLRSCGISFLFQTTVEVFDGFSSQWGFSFGDVISNTSGILLFGVQQLSWNEQKIKLKYSFHQTMFSKYRPNLLGSNLPENILKDYNGLTYWISASPSSFIKDNHGFPKWLGLSIGFGADGLVGGESNPSEVDGKNIPAFERRRQFYIALDIDLAKIKTKSEFINSVFHLINIVHIPTPTIEFTQNKKPIFHSFYF